MRIPRKERSGKKFKNNIVYYSRLILGCFFFLNNSYAENAFETIIIMRHGEKPTFGLGQLNCQGLNRSLFLPQVLDRKFGKPDYIFAPNPSAKIWDWIGFFNYVRPLATILPTAIQLKIPINTAFEYQEVEKLANELLSPVYSHSTLFVAWEHLKAYELSRLILKKLNQNPDKVPIWRAEDYDSLYIIKIYWGAEPVLVTFDHDYQNLNDHSSICPETMPNLHLLPRSDNHFMKIQRYIFVPVAESDENETGLINCQGLNRALHLTIKLKEMFGEIDEFIATAPNDQVADNAGNLHFYLKAIMTLEPATIYAGKHMQIPVGFQQTTTALQYLTDKKFDNKIIVVAWKRAELLLLVKSIHQLYGGNPIDITDHLPNHDDLYVLTIVRRVDEVFTHFKNMSENLENLSTTCPLSIHTQQYSIMRLLKSIFAGKKTFDYGHFVYSQQIHKMNFSKD